MNKFDYKKSLGQNFIKDNNIISKIVNASSIDKDTLVIEIGPGSGSLSSSIVPLAGFSILYEIDTRLCEVLNNKLQMYKNYEIIFNDVLKQNIQDNVSKYNFKKTYVIANLPYYITTPIITKVINEVFPDKIVIMVQNEVADRLSANVGTRDYGMITVLLSSRYNVKKLFKVSRNCFEPIPNVDSAVISLEKKEVNNIISMNKFERLIKDAFQFKRKNLKNNLKHYNLDIIDGILKDNGFSLNSRAEDIPTELFIEISNNI